MDPYELLIREIQVLQKTQAKIQSRIGRTNENLARMDENLKEHMRRTELAEQSIHHLVEALQPVKKHVSHVEGALRFLGILALTSTIVATVWSLFF